MRVIATYTRWGNLYRGRFYINGARVTESRYDEVIAAAVIDGANIKSTTEEGSGMGFNYRYVKEIENVRQTSGIEAHAGY